MEAHDLLAIRVSVDDDDVNATVKLWRLFRRLKNEVNVLSAAAMLRIVGRSTPTEYRRTMMALEHRVDRLGRDVAALDTRAPEVADLASVVLALAGQIRRHAQCHPSDAEDAWRHAIEAYQLGRLVAGDRWALEMRPEGLPIRPEALARFRTDQ